MFLPGSAPSCAPTPWSRWRAEPAPLETTPQPPAPWSWCASNWTTSNGGPDGATTEHGVALSWQTMNRLLCDADVCRVVTHGASRVIDVGRSERTATQAQRNALLIRDGGCVFPGCDRPPGWCQAHHIVWWEHGGTTDLSNLAYLCNRHHVAVHKGLFTITRDHNGQLLFTHANGTILDNDPILGRQHHRRAYSGAAAS